MNSSDAVHGERESKRQRTAIACDSCRARKSRCDGMRPACGMCLDMEFHCQYTKRGGRNRPAVAVESTENEQESVSTIQKRLDAMEKLLQAVLSREASGMTTCLPQSSDVTELLHPDTSSSVIIDDHRTPLQDAIIDDDTVDGMGMVTFAEEAASIIQAISLNPEKSNMAEQSLVSMGINRVSRPSSPHVTRSTGRDSWSQEPYVLPPRAKIIELVDAFFTRPVRRSWLCLLNAIMAFSAALGAGKNDTPAQTCTDEADVFLQRALQLLPDLAKNVATLETQALEETPHGLSMQGMGERPARNPAVIYIESIKLYKLIGEIIDGIYQNNIASDAQVSNSDLLKRVISIEQKLHKWKLNLPPNLRVMSQEEIMQSLPDSSPSLGLSIVVTMRYHIARILLHRPVILRFLASKNGTSDESESPEFLQYFGKPSLELGVSSASEMIDIIMLLSSHQEHILTTWWFCIYYIFSASLLIFGALILERKWNTSLLQEGHFDLPGTLQKALVAMRNIGDGTRMAARCIKYLGRLVEMIPASDSDATADLHLPRHEDLAQLNHLLHTPDSFEFSDADLDAGLNLFTCGWDAIIP
ncbi:hypothetical protein FE257_002049 [Aspergillus nanangensis]|uniref:Zn(2)-C6 fungal-type domain-containing protein n=1 Tax=Aspergillus nanangensis TaxID=2582783 RepID=A0AAD4GWU6_ASPNN|nr:hypothetical protein FE257_002049 [Aspergillus nanangensis]